MTTFLKSRQRDGCVWRRIGIFGRPYVQQWTSFSWHDDDDENAVVNRGGALLPSYSVQKWDVTYAGMMIVMLQYVYIMMRVAVSEGTTKSECESKIIAIIITHYNIVVIL